MEYDDPAQDCAVAGRDGERFTLRIHSCHRAGIVSRVGMSTPLPFPAPVGAMVRRWAPLGAKMGIPLSDVPSCSLAS